MPATEERQTLREDFLSTFVRALIFNSYKADKEKSEELLEQIKEIKEKSVEKLPLVPKKALMKPGKKFVQTLSILPKKPVQKLPLVAPIKLPEYKPVILQLGQKPETVTLGKIAPILRDPSVFSVECPGPTKNVLVNRSGVIQTTSTVLTKEEIQEIMENISEKTRIPLIPGVFKSAFQDLIITAVVSEFVGTRFIIQKRMPFQKY